ncbi:DUF5320 domain-containing protein [Clostridiaceae bacterium 35-E11]
MPKFDGTGPRAEGAMTGYGRGYCIMPLKEVKSTMINKRLNEHTPVQYWKKERLYKRNRRVFGKRRRYKRRW